MTAFRRLTGAPPRLEIASDEELLRATAAGDGGALAELFRRHHTAVFRFCTRFSDAEAEDLAQQTFLVAFREARRFRGGSRVSTWLMGIASNLARRSARSASRREVALDLLATAPRDEPASAPDALSRRQLAARLPAAIARLPHHLRVVYVMCEVEGVPGAEAARALELRPGTLWRRLHDARKRLLAMLEEGDP